MGFHHSGQAGLELLISGDPPTLASQSVGTTGVSRCARPDQLEFNGTILAHCNLHLPDSNFYSPSEKDKLLHDVSHNPVPILEMRILSKNTNILKAQKHRTYSIMALHHNNAIAYNPMLHVGVYRQAVRGTNLERPPIASLLPRLEYSGTITVYCSLDLPGSRDPLSSASQIPGTRGMH
ncbi:hypothetical protein AAY473_010255 [Plecturocebus cupreus]